MSNKATSGIDLKTLYAMAIDKDWYGNPIIKKSKGKVIIYTHYQPSYYGDGYEPTQDDFYELFASYDEKEMKIIDTYALDDEYKGMRILTEKEIEAEDNEEKN